MEYKGDFSLPFNEKNPLNYVKPITVNIYFKQSTPGVGQYNPKPVEANKNGHSSIFLSKNERALIPENKLDYQRNMPAPGDYDRMDGFDIMYPEDDDRKNTAAFREPIPKKIVPVNLYDPHSEPENEKSKKPEPCSYKLPRLFDVAEQPED